MADGNDGSIIIDTELDTTGFEKGSDKLTKAIENAANAFDNFGDNMMRSFGHVIPLLQSIAGSAAQINAALGGTATQTEAATSTIVDSEQRVQQAAKGAAEAVNAQGEAANTFSGNMINTQGSVSALEREVNSLSSGLQSVSNSTEMGFANGKAVLAFDAKLQELEQRLAAAREHLVDFGNAQIPTEGYTTLTQQIGKAEQALFRLYERRDEMQELGVNENSAQWQHLALQITNAEAQLARYERSRDALIENGTAFIKGSQTAEYTQIQDALDDAAEALERNEALINQQALAQARLNVLTAQEAVAAATTTRAREAAMERLRVAQQELNSLADSMSNRSDMEPPDRSISGWQRFGDALKKVASAALRLSGIRRVVGSLKDFVKQGKQSRSMAEALTRSLTSLRRMLVTRIKNMFISAIFNGAKENLQELAKFSDAFNKSMSNIKNAAKGLSANLSVSMGGLISAIEPVLTRILNLLSRVISYINAFFAMLGGKSTITVAKKQMDNYSGALSGAAGSAKKLKREVYGFDELNRQSSDDGGGGGGGAADLFEEVPIDSLLPGNIKSLFQSIKDAVAAENWHEVGMLIASGLNIISQTVDDWINNTFRPAGVKWAANIAEILNGLTDGIDWNLSGKKIADGLSAIADIYNTFMDTYDFENLGTSFGVALNGFVNNIEWANIGKAFAQKWQALVELIHGFVYETDWSALGTGIGTSISGWFTNIDWVKMADGIVTGFNGLITTLRKTIQTIDWTNMGKTLANSVMTLVTTINWNEIGGLLMDSVLAIIDSVITILTTVDWGSVLQSVISAVGDIIANLDWLGLLKRIAVAIIGIIGQIPGIILSAVGGIINVVSGIFRSLGIDSIGGFLKGIGDAMAGIGSWIKEHIVDPVVNWVKKLLGIHSPSTVFEEIGDDLISGLLQGISNSWSSITSFFSTAVSNLKNTLSTAWDSIKTRASEKWESIKSTITEKWDALKSTLNNTDWASVGSNICSGIKNGIEAGWTWLSNTVSNLARNLLSKAKNALGIASPSKLFRDEVGVFIGLGIAEGISDTETDIMDTVKNIATETVNGFEAEKATLQIDTAGGDLASRLSIISDKLASIASVFQNISSYLGNVGELKIPYIATGEVSPYKTRVEGSPVDAAPDNFSALMEDVVKSNVAGHEAIVNILKDILETLLGIEIGDDVIGRAAARYIRRMNLITGG